jgi:GH24 family phage-related lysozyme (muramidase)
MRASVEAAFMPFTVGFEGRTTWQYLDSTGLVTCGIGFLIDPVDEALTYPWLKRDGSTAPANDVRDEWARVKSLQAMRVRGGGAFAAVTTLRLSDATIDAKFATKRDAVDGQLAERFASYPDWPSDAQLAVLSIAWNAGAAWRAPKFQAHADAVPPDFVGMAAESAIHSARDASSKVLLTNAAAVAAQGLDPDVLYWPRVLTVDVA